MIFLASLEIEKKDVQEEQDVNRLIYIHKYQHKSSDNISDDFLILEHVEGHLSFSKLLKVFKYRVKIKSKLFAQHFNFKHKCYII